MSGGHTILAGWSMSGGEAVARRLECRVFMLNGLLFSLLFEAQAGLAAWAGVSWRLVLLSVAWGLLVPGLGVTQAALLPGDLHWLVQVAHLLGGLVAIGLAHGLARGAQARLAERSVALAA